MNDILRTIKDTRNVIKAFSPHVETYSIDFNYSYTAEWDFSGNSDAVGQMYAILARKPLFTLPYEPDWLLQEDISISGSGEIILFDPAVIPQWVRLTLYMSTSNFSAGSVFMANDIPFNYAETKRMLQADLNDGITDQVIDFWASGSNSLYLDDYYTPPAVGVPLYLYVVAEADIGETSGPMTVKFGVKNISVAVSGFFHRAGGP